MELPDFNLVKTERDFLLWLVGQDNPGLNFLPEDLLFIEPFSETVLPTTVNVETTVTQRRPGNRPVIHKNVEYQRVDINELLPAIDVSLVGPPNADNILYIARRVLVRELRSVGIDFDPVCEVKDKTVTTEGNITTVSANAVFNSQCLFGTLPVKVAFTSDPTATIKTLAPSLTLTLTPRDLSYQGVQYGEIDSIPEVNEQLKIIYGALVRENPGFVAYFPTPEQIVSVKSGWVDRVKKITFKDATNASITVSVTRVDIRTYQTSLRSEVLVKYQITPTYYTSTNNRKTRFCMMYNEFFVDIKKMPPVIESLAELEVGKATNGFTTYTFMANDYIYRGYNPDSLRVITKPDIDNIAETSIVGVLLTDVTEG